MAALTGRSRERLGFPAVRIPSGDLAPARRRKRYGGSYGRSKRRTGRVLLALVLLAGGGAVVYALQRDDRGAAARVALRPCPVAPTTSPATQPAQPAQPKPVALPQPRQVRLLLLNGTTRNGLGRNIGNQLAARGFVVSGTGNAHALLTGPSQVTYGPGALPAAQLVGMHVVGATLVDAPRTARGRLQLVLGSGFARLRTPAEIASLTTRPAPVAAKTVAPAPRPSGCRP